MAYKVYCFVSLPQTKSSLTKQKRDQADSLLKKIFWPKYKNE